MKNEGLWRGCREEIKMFYCKCVREVHIIFLVVLLHEREKEALYQELWSGSISCTSYVKYKNVLSRCVASR